MKSKQGSTILIPAAAGEDSIWADPTGQAAGGDTGRATTGGDTGQETNRGGSRRKTDANQPISASQLKVMTPGSRLIKIRENDNHNGLRISVHVTNKTLTAEL